jgi:hypothetical protein
MTTARASSAVNRFFHHHHHHHHYNDVTHLPSRRRPTAINFLNSDDDLYDMSTTTYDKRRHRRIEMTTRQAQMCNLHRLGLWYFYFITLLDYQLT